MASEHIDHGAGLADSNSLKTDKPWHLWLLSIAGGIISVIPDCIQNDNAALIPKMCDKLLTKHFLVPSNIAPFLALLIIMLISLVICIVYLPKTRVDAFARGAAVLVLLTSGFTYDPGKVAPTPSADLQNQRKVTRVPQILDDPKQKSDNRVDGSQTNKKAKKTIQSEENLLVDIKAGLINMMSSDAYAAEQFIFNENLEVVLNENFSNATVLKNEWISMNKPSYSGPFGLGSLFGNTIKIMKKDHTLGKNKRVRILELFDTEFRSYRYIKIQYKRNGKILKGWIWAGKSPHSWLVVKPDNPDTPLAGDILSIVKKKVSHY